MKVIICGAGQVGASIARYLCTEANDITIIDTEPELVRRIQESHDVQGIVGHAAHPEVLRDAGAESADMLVAVTYADEVNMVACQVAHSLFSVPTKVARVRAQSYLAPVWADLFSRDNMPIDVIISPEMEVARAVEHRLSAPGTIDMVPFVDGLVRLIGVRCTEDCPVVFTPLRQLSHLFPELCLQVVAIFRQDRGMVPLPDEQIFPGDEVYFVVDAVQTRRALAAFGHEESQARRLMVLGGGNIGLYLAHHLEEVEPHAVLKLLERDKVRADVCAKALTRTQVFNGDVLDRDILEEAGIDTIETVMAVTNDDETNVLASLLAKRFSVERAITLINKNDYNHLVSTLGVDAVVNPQTITVSTILQHIRRGRIYGVHSLRDGFGELIEADAMETSGLVGKPLKDVRLPRGVLVGLVVRQGKVLPPRGALVLEAGDRVVLFAAADAVRKVERMFSVRLEYF